MYHMWFLYSILSIYLCIPFIYKGIHNLTKKEYSYLIILFLLLSIYISFSMYFDIPLPNSFSFIPVNICFFILGDYFNKFQRLNNYKYIILKILLIMLSIYMIWSIVIEKSIANQHLTETFLYFNNVFVGIGTVSTFLLCKDYISYINISSTIKYILKHCSNATFTCYLVHILFLDQIYTILYAHNYYNSSYPIISAIIVSILTFLFSITLGLLINKCPIIKNIF